MLTIRRVKKIILKCLEILNIACEWISHRFTQVLSKSLLDTFLFCLLSTARVLKCSLRNFFCHLQHKPYVSGCAANQSTVSHNRTWDTREICNLYNQITKDSQKLTQGISETCFIGAQWTALYSLTYVTRHFISCAISVRSWYAYCSCGCHSPRVSWLWRICFTAQHC
jgi:hypothetical protein